MKSVGYIRNPDGSIMYPFTYQSSGRNLKFEILKPNSIDPYSLSKSFKYKAEDINTSIIYSQSTRILYRFGPTQVVTRILKLLSKEYSYALFVGGRIPNLVIEDYEIRAIENNLQGGSSSKTKGLKYETVIKDLRLIDPDFTYKVQGSTTIASLQHFIDTKNLRLEEKDYKCLDTYEKVQEYVDSVDWTQIEYTAKDTETTGLDFFNSDADCHIVGMSHSYKDKQGVYIPFCYQGTILLEPQKVFEIMKPIFDNTRQVWQNGDFDKRVFRTEGIEERIDEELTVLQKLINPSEKQPIALKYVARKLLGEDTIELTEILGNKFDPKRVEYIPLDLITVYACGDTDYTLRIFKLLKQTVSKSLWNLYRFDVINYNIVSDTNWYGLPIRSKTLAKLIDDSNRDLIRMRNLILNYITTEGKAVKLKEMLAERGHDISTIGEDKIKTIMNSEQFNRYMEPWLRGTREPSFELDYAADRKKILYQLLKYPVLRRTKGGDISTGADYFRDVDVYVKDESSDILKEDLISVDGKSILLEKDEINRKVFPLGYMLKQYSTKQHEHEVYASLAKMQSGEFSFSEYKFNGTETGRLSNRIQTIPSYAKKVVGFEEDSQYGMIIFDFDQIELRGVHNEAIRMWLNLKSLPEVQNNPDHIVNTYEWEHIVEVFNSFWKDVHSEMTASFNNCKVKDVTKAMRKKGKTVNFAGVYGATAATMARNDLIKAKTPEQRQEIIASYADTKNRWLCTNLHLYNYFRTTQEMGLEPIPVEEIPYNIDSENVGRTIARSGRQRFYILDNMTSKSLSHISNASRNQYIQSYCRDVYFTAVQNLEKALRESGLTHDDIRSVLYVHDEEGMMYDKTKINPLWLAAMVYKYCCIQIEGSPIKYYCTPAIACNWEEGKADKYEIPKEMLANLSTDPNDYEILDTLNHRDYMLSKISDFYCEKILTISKSYIRDKVYEVSDFNTEQHYYLVGKLKMYQEGITLYTGNSDYDHIFNCLYRKRDYFLNEDIDVRWFGKSINWDEIVQQETDFGEIAIDDSMSEEFDMDAFMDSNEELFSVDDSGDDYTVQTTNEFGIIEEQSVVKSVVDRKSIEELNAKFTNIRSIKEKEQQMTNILYEEFMHQATIFLNPMEGKKISTEDFKKLNKILQDSNIGTGVSIFYSMQGKLIDTKIQVSPAFKFRKFDEYISSLRK